MSVRSWSPGSRWLRWDPHLHTPGTLRNDQFNSDWDGYLHALESASPAVHAVGITDYHTLRSYKEVVRRRASGALPGIPLVFANVELRLTVETRTGQAINLHLLISPDAPQHVERTEEQLGTLKFVFRGEPYFLNDPSLIRLGREHRNEPNLAEIAALKEGSNQFKVDLAQLKDIFKSSTWFADNVLVAISGGNDGLAGLSQDAAFKALREELGRFADIIFSGQPSHRKYWLGDHPNFEADRQRPKPCLHGSDAHELARVLAPENDRRCWIRGGADFATLRQALFEPERRVHIGDIPPPGPNSADVICEVTIKGTAWGNGRTFSLNDGLVTIIGARGSGKTALADLIAVAAGAGEPDPGPASFIKKAGDLLDGTEVELRWGDTSTSRASFPLSKPTTDAHDSGRARYLSQQFVERLCAPDGLADTLVRELERIVFEAIPEEDRQLCSSFDELRRTLLAEPTAKRDADREAIRERTRTIAAEYKLQLQLPQLREKATQASRLRAGLEGEIAKIPVPGGDAKVKTHRDATNKLNALTTAIQRVERRKTSLADVRSDVQRQLRAADLALDGLRARYPNLLAEDVWEQLRLRVDQTGTATLNRAEQEAENEVARLREFGLVQEPSGSTNGLAALKAEVERAEKELGLDKANQKHRTELAGKLEKAKLEETRCAELFANAEKAPERRKRAHEERLTLYQAVFEALGAEERALTKLYAPLQARLANDERLTKLEFFVRRDVDVDEWASRGENLMDLRKSPFGRGGLAATAKEVLLNAWREGTPDLARGAMESFLEVHATKASEALAQGATPAEFGEWLFSTAHIRVRYGIRYEGVEIANLSPGTRGVVLLTLYLALDEWDTRPLIIDQPEENLDPRSVFSELVPFFRTAARRRQIIMVTHNANLVVNADADQVVIAEAVRASANSLPSFEYRSGGLEAGDVATGVCAILEGGPEAFRRRSERYGYRK
jgi:hypothetical protein